jgi:hypothetical protein
MLRRRTVPLLVALTVLVGLSVTATMAGATSQAPANQAPAIAMHAAAPCKPGTPVCCPDSDPNCTVHDTDPGKPGDPGKPPTNGPHKCLFQGQEVRCSDPVVGIYIGGGCYAVVQVVQPDWPPPAGQNPNDGKWTVRTCFTDASLATVRDQGFWWMPNGLAIPPSPAEVARTALASIRLDGAAVGFAPSPDGAGLVGLPVWMWTEVNANTWGPVTASATDTGLTVTITAKAQQIVWNMGNGDSVTCANPGTKYEAWRGRSASPNCGYTYRTASRNQPGGRYAITATTTWQVDWAGGGETGTITTTRTSNITIRIDELQVVVG